MDTSQNQTTSQPKLPEKMGWVAFLETAPPGKESVVADFIPSSIRYTGGGYGGVVNNEVLHLYCNHEACGGERTFYCIKPLGQIALEVRNYILTYRCRNCQSTDKHFAFRVLHWEQNTYAIVVKYGEYPAFGPPTPRKLLALLDTDATTYLRGRQAENQGLGIGAFAYYRRVVENQKSRLIKEIIKVAEREHASDEMIAELTAAASERQFSKAIALIKHGIPKSVLIKDHNPLTLLHSALSEGLHAESDATCLKMAEAIRVILVQLADRLSELLRDDAQVNAAVTMLLRKGETGA